jgi:MOSC domain-containing protein YiiM
LRQVHLIPAELLDELTAKGFSVAPGQIGDNMTTRGIDLVALPTESTDIQVLMGEDVVEIRGQRKHYEETFVIRSFTHSL